MKVIVTFLLLMFATTANSAQQHQHSLVGSHGMVLFQDRAQQLYASHLPLYYHPHDHQIVYKVAITGDTNVHKLLEQGMVTVLPDVFDLSVLLEGKPLTISTKFYQGHFERGGKQVEQHKLMFTEPVYLRAVKKNGVKPKSQFDIVPLSEQQSLYIHQIEPSPSFDLLGLIDNGKVKTDTIFCEKTSEISQQGLMAFSKNCGLPEPVYIEYKDFK